MSRLPFRSTLVVALLVLAPVACTRAAKPVPQPAAKTTPQQTGERPTSTPYSGDLSIFETPGRDQRLQIDRVMKLLKLGKGSTIADIGAGSGWFTVRAAKRVGPTGVVYAEDINPAAISFITDRAKKEHFSNIHPVLGTPDDPKLAPASLDAVLMLKVYHEIAQPVKFMENLRLPLRRGGLVGVIDRNGNGSGTDHGIPQAVVEREMDEAGYREVAKYDFTKADGQDYFLIFTMKVPPHISE